MPRSAPKHSDEESPATQTIKHWSPDERPREKMMRRGVGALTNAELLAVLVSTGTERETAVDLMKRLLTDQGNTLGRLGRLSLHDLTAYRGIGPAKALTLMAALELGRRRASEPAAERPRIESSQAMYELLAQSLADLPHEESHLLLFDRGMHLIGQSLISRGGLAATVVDVRIVLREALLNRAAAIALCHNHPSGQVQPSPQDDQLTAQLAKAAATMDIQLIDHLIIGNKTYYSYADQGKL